jgi:hypothetical protein
MSEMLNAFLKNQKFTDEQADEYEQYLKDLERDHTRMAIEQLSSEKPSLINFIGGQTQIKDGELDQKTIPHDHFKDYDHSLEKVRINFKRDQGIEFGDLGSEDV